MKNIRACGESMYQNLLMIIWHTRVVYVECNDAAVNFISPSFCMVFHVNHQHMPHSFLATHGSTCKPPTYASQLPRYSLKQYMFSILLFIVLFVDCWL
jgi:hypothetical protein